MSDDEDDVIVLQVCNNKQCLGIEDLEFDEETGEMYCANCRMLFARAESEGFHVLLGPDDISIVNMIFNCFSEDKSYWNFTDFQRFQEHIDRSGNTEIDSHEILREYFKEEYDVELLHGDNEEYVITLRNLEDMYGGYLYNDVNALYMDCEALEAAGLLNTAVLE